MPAGPQIHTEAHAAKHTDPSYVHPQEHRSIHNVTNTSIYTETHMCTDTNLHSHPHAPGAMHTCKDLHHYAHLILTDTHKHRSRHMPSHSLYPQALTCIPTHTLIHTCSYAHAHSGLSTSSPALWASSFPTHDHPRGIWARAGLLSSE